MPTSHPASKQIFADETDITPVIYTKINDLYDTVESLEDEVGYSGDLASDSGSIRAQLRNQQAIGAHSSDVVAAAATLTLPHTRYIVVTGTTTVTSITAAGTDDKRQAVLEIADVLTVEDGNNIDLGGQDYTGPGFLELVCDGVDWHELSRLPGLTTGHGIIVGSGSGTALPDQPNLHFSSAFTGANDTGNSETDIGVNFGTATGTVAEGNDARLSDARTPTAHASTHITGGTDIIPLFGVNARGLVPGPTTASGTKFLNDAGQWIPASSAGMPTIYGPDGTPLTQRTIIQAVGEMAKVEDATDDRTLLHFRFGKYSATTLTASGTLVALPTDGNIVGINGNTQIETIPAPTTGYDHRLVVLYFGGSPLVKDGTGNLQLDGDFQAAPGYMLGLFHNTVDWVEAFRSHPSGGGGGITGVEVFDEASDLGEFQTLKFIGAGVVATDAGGGIAEITVSGGGGGGGGGTNQFSTRFGTVVVPAIASFPTTVNTAGATATDETDVGIYVVCPEEGSDNWKLWLQAAPGATPWVKECLLVCSNAALAGNYSRFHMIGRNAATGAFFTLGLELTGPGTQNITAHKWSSVTSVASTSINSAYFERYVWLRMGDDGANVSFWVSGLGRDFGDPVISVSRDLGTSQFVDQVGFGINNTNSKGTFGGLLSWRTV